MRDDRARWKVIAFAVGLTACTDLAGLDELDFESSATTTVGAGGQGSTAATGGAGGSGGSCSDDLTSDPEHCGTCGHSCLGGACMSSRCQALMLADGQESPLHVAANEDYVYWTIFTNPGEIRRMDRLTEVTTVIASNLARPSYLTVTATHLYWSEYDGDRVVRAALDGTSPQEIVAAPTANQAFGLVIDGSTVYWNHGGATGSLQSQPIGGPPPVQLLGPLDFPEGLWLHGGSLYVAEEGAGLVFRYPLPNGPTEIVTESATNPVGVAADDDYVYFTDQDEGELWRVPQPTGTPELLFDDGDQNGGVYITDDAIFWTSYSGGRVMMLAK